MSRMLVGSAFVLAILVCDRATLAQDKDKDKVSAAEAKAGAELAKVARVTVDEKHPDKPVVMASFYARQIDEKTATLFNAMPHLKNVGGYDVTFAPGVLKLLKTHPGLDTIHFQGRADLTAMKDLADGPPIKTLVLGDGAFTTEHFEGVAKAASLRAVHVLLFRVKPDVLRPLHKLKNLDSLHVTGWEPFTADDLTGFTSLSHLTCAAPHKSEAFFDALAKMKNLRTLTLQVAVPEGQTEPPKTPPAGLAKVAALTDLTGLTIDGPVGEANLAALAPLKTLTSLRLVTTDLTATGVKGIQAFPKLSAITLEGPPMPEAAVVELGKLKGLKSLRIHVGPLTDAGVAAIANLTDLEELALYRFDKGANAVVPHILKLTKLRSLDLTFSDLNDTSLKQFAALKELTELKVAFAKTTPEAQESLKKVLPKLTIILSGTTRPFP